MLDEPQDLFEQAVLKVWAEKKVSTSWLQRQLGIGYNAAARLVERMESLGVVSAANAVGKREVRNPDDLRRALSIRDEVWAIAGGDAERGQIMLRALTEGLAMIDGVKAEAAALHAHHFKGRPPLKPDAEFDKMSADAYAVTADELRQFVERFEHLEAEKKDIADQQKEVMAEAKGRGYDTKVLRKIISLRKRKPDEVAEEEAVLDLYKSALGMA